MLSMSGLSLWNTTAAMISLWVDFLNVTASVKPTGVQIATVMFPWAITFVDLFTVMDVCRLSWSDLTRWCREQQIQFICGASAKSVVKFVAFVHVFSYSSFLVFFFCVGLTSVEIVFEKLVSSQRFLFSVDLCILILSLSPRVVLSHGMFFCLEPMQLAHACSGSGNILQSMQQE